ncbi:MAG: formylglycine-generating enzyme family protein [Gammaproteobacteria bacterium]|nr:formylglycine-generating enzyme family protein [Gammaproteobacteria bacterium]
MKHPTPCIIFFCLLLSGCEQPPAADASVCGLDQQQHGRFITIQAGGFTRGQAPRYPEEGQPRAAETGTFAIQTHEVTNRQYQRFVEATGYVSDAERSSQSGRADGGSGLFVMPQNMRSEGNWRLARDASWRDPLGDGSGIIDKMSLPVVHVSLRDAQAYAKWAGGRLPTELEWEHAAALGLSNPADQQSGAFDNSGQPIANTWQGIFPLQDKATDGFSGAAPVGCYAASEIGLYDMIGNVWEWTTTAYRAPGAAHNSYTIKGGSFLCADNYCGRYRPAARQPQEADFSMSHIGFRIVKDPG